MPEKLLRCVRKVKADLAEENPDWSDKRRNKVATAICVKSTGLPMKHSNPTVQNMFSASFGENGKVENISFSFKTPLKFIEKSELQEKYPQYKLRDPDSITVVGRAAIAGVSANFSEFFAAELKKAGKTLKGVPCQADHSESARDTIGLVTDQWWDESLDPPELSYIAELDGSDPVSQKVAKGYVSGVSVAGGAKQVICSVCGEEWDWLHEHIPGKKYKGVLCTKQFKGIFFRHLGFTPFPAVEGADASYVANSMDEALENTMAFLNHVERQGAAIKHESTSPEAGLVTFGESNQLTDNPDLVRELEREKLKSAQLAQDMEKLQEKLTNMATLEETLEKQNKIIKEGLVSDILGLQAKLSIDGGKSADERRSVLEKESLDTLRVKADVMRESAANLPEPEVEESIIRSRSLNLDAAKGHKFGELDKERKEHYIREAKLEKLSLGLFDQRPSVSAVKTLKEWDYDLGKWRTDLSDLFKAAPKMR